MNKILVIATTFVFFVSGCGKISKNSSDPGGPQPAVHTGSDGSGRLPDPLPNDPYEAQRALERFLAATAEPLLKEFGKPYQQARWMQPVPDDDDMASKGWSNVDLAFGWYYCTASDNQKIKRIIMSHGYKDTGYFKGDMVSATLGDLYVEFGPLRARSNCSLSFTTPIVKLALPGDGSTTSMDKYLGRYKDRHADPNYDLGTKPPHPKSYYGTPRG